MGVRIFVFVFLWQQTSSLLYMQPYSLRNLFYREETVIGILQNVQKIYSSRRLTDYLDSVAPRLKELDLLQDLQDEVGSMF